MSSFADNLLKEACNVYGFNFEDVLYGVNDKSMQGYIVSLLFNLTERPVDNHHLAGAILMWDLYKNASTNIKEYAKTFEKHLRPDVYDFLVNHADELQPHLNFKKDFELNYFSAGTLLETYLARLSYDQQPMEVPQMSYLRIAVGEFADDVDAINFIIKTYKLYSDRKITVASPTFFNEGFKDGAPISCMIYTVADDMEDILDIIKEAGLASKNSAGLGIDFTSLRHSAIGRKGRSQGIIPLLKIWDDLMKYITQGGHRNGACTASLRDFHYDLPEFIRLLDKTNEDQRKVQRLNLSIMISDLFMKRVKENGEWHLFCPKQANELIDLHGKAYEEKYCEMEAHAEKWVRYRKWVSANLLLESDLHDNDTLNIVRELNSEFKGKEIPRRVECRTFKAVDIMNSICDIQIKCGGPYIVYSCSINRKNAMSNVGPVRSSNLCQETMIPAVAREQTGSCNLAAISLPAFATHDRFDFIGLGEAVRSTVIALNRVIDTAKNVSNKVKTSNAKSRPLGIGVSGFSDMLALMDWTVVTPTYDFTSKGLLRRQLNPKVDELNWKIWSCMYYNALISSMEEAKRFGYCPSFEGSPISKGKLQYHMWQDEEKETGRTYPFKLYPADPSSWGQEGTWDTLIEEIKSFGVRNMLLLSVQPTASSAQTIGNCESVEYHMSNIYTRKVLSGNYPVLNEHAIRDLEAINAWNTEVYNTIVNADGSLLSVTDDMVAPEHVDRLRYIKEKYLTMWEIPQRIMVNLAAQRQICICQSQSMNLFIASPSIEQLKRVHEYNWSLGLKTGMYYLRTKAAAEPLKIGFNKISVSDKTKMIIGNIISDKIVTVKGSQLVEVQDKTLASLIEKADRILEEESKKIQADTEKTISSVLTASRPMVCERKAGCISCT